MKKVVKKLSLSKENLRKLDPRQLGEVAGGYPPNSYISCKFECDSNV